MEAVLCGTCGYNLRGSPLQGNCPECNTEYDQAVLWRNQTRSVQLPRSCLSRRYLPDVCPHREHAAQAVVHFGLSASRATASGLRARTA